MIQSWNIEELAESNEVMILLEYESITVKIYLNKKQKESLTNQLTAIEL